MITNAIQHGGLFRVLVGGQNGLLVCTKVVVMPQHVFQLKRKLKWKKLNEITVFNLTQILGWFLYSKPLVCV